MRFHVEVQGERLEVEVSVVEEGWSKQFILRLKGEEGEVEKRADLLFDNGGRLLLSVDGSVERFLVAESDGTQLINWEGETLSTIVRDARDYLAKGGALAATDGSAMVQAQMPGKVVRLLKKSGDSVESGEGVLVIEAMKMQNEVKSPADGKLLRCDLSEGDNVEMGQLLFEVG